MLERINELAVWPASGAPSLAHWKLKGPVPRAVVLKVTVSPGQLVCETSASAVVGTLTVKVAKLVVLLQAPMTCTKYVPALAAVMLESASKLLVWLSSRVPSLAHWKLKGPVPA